MNIKLIECPRDAMQGFDKFIETNLKVRYINALLQVGFDTLDCGSFVNPKIIPQMADTPKVLKVLNMTKTKLSVIVANLRGAKMAVEFDEITYLGFPFSVSETFQRRNTNATIEESLKEVELIIDLCGKYNKKFICYLPMSFGNSFNDPWSVEIVGNWVKRLTQSGADYFSLADTIGVSNPNTIQKVISHLTSEFPDLKFGCHFHTRTDAWKEKIEAALDAGCHRFDGALKGFGGCPMADDVLVGNMPTENMVFYFKSLGYDLGLDNDKFNEAMLIAAEVFA